MRQVRVLKTAMICGAVGLMGMAGTSFGQTVVNGDFSSPTLDPTVQNTDTSATGWTLNPAVGDNYTNPGDRCAFGTTSPGGSAWSFWEQTFVQYGSATQSISGVVADNTYTMSADMQFQDGTGPGQGFNAVTLANQASDSKSADTGDLYAYIGLVFINGHGSPIGTLDADGLDDETTIPAGSVTTYEVGTTGANPWANFSVSGIAPAGTASLELVLGWQNGGLDGNTGGQSVFATDVTLVPEPASLSLLGIGALGLLSRRRSRMA